MPSDDVLGRVAGLGFDSRATGDDATGMEFAGWACCSWSSDFFVPPLETNAIKATTAIPIAATAKGHLFRFGLHSSIAGARIPDATGDFAGVVSACFNLPAISAIVHL